MILPETALQLFVISLGDDAVQIGTLLLSDRFQAEGEKQTVQKAVHSVNPGVDCVDPVMIQKMGAVGAQISGI